MKLRNVKIGQILEDVYGNKYEVLEVAKSYEYYPILVRCIDFKKPVKVDTQMYGSITSVGQRTWILKDRSLMLPIEDGPGKFIKDNFYSSLALGGSLERITLQSSNGTKRHFLLGQRSTIDSITLTLDEMKIVEDEVDYPTSDNAYIGMKVVDGEGKEYKVIDLNMVSVQLGYISNFTAMDGTVNAISATIQVPYYKKGAGFACSTKDFQIVKDK